MKKYLEYEGKINVKLFLKWRNKFSYFHIKGFLMFVNNGKVKADRLLNIQLRLTL
jgi:hypothetical protein